MREVNPKRWKTSAIAVYDRGYQLRWCPRFRGKVLPGASSPGLKDLLPESAGMAWLTDGSHAPCP